MAEGGADGSVRPPASSRRTPRLAPARRPPSIGAGPCSIGAKLCGWFPKPGLIRFPKASRPGLPASSTKLSPTSLARNVSRRPRAPRRSLRGGQQRPPPPRRSRPKRLRKNRQPGPVARLFKSGPTASPPRTGFWRKSLPRGIARSATRARASNSWRRNFWRQRKAPPSSPTVSSANGAWRATACRKNSIPRPARTRGCRARRPKRTACSPMHAPGSNIGSGACRGGGRMRPAHSRRRQSVRQASGRNVARHHGRKAFGRGAGTSAGPHHRD